MHSSIGKATRRHLKIFVRKLMIIELVEQILLVKHQGAFSYFMKNEIPKSRKLTIFKTYTLFTRMNCVVQSLDKFRRINKLFIKNFSFHH
jgi:hypothetical protein